MFNPQNAANKQHWQQLNPESSITDSPLSGLKPPFKVDPSLMTRRVHQLLDEGYFKVDSLIPESEIQPLAHVVTAVSYEGYPPVFAFVYDEFWRLLARYSRVVEPVLGKDYKLKLADPWIWHIDKEDAGFAPHRDLPMQASHADGSPAILSLWIPLSDATPLNGCIYVLPTQRDPNFPDKLDKNEVRLEDLQNIRAVPAAAGSVLAWSPAILHWGSRSSRWAAAPEDQHWGFLYTQGFQDTSGRFRTGLFIRPGNHH